MALSIVWSFINYKISGEEVGEEGIYGGVSIPWSQNEGPPGFSIGNGRMGFGDNDESIGVIGRGQ